MHEPPFGFRRRPFGETADPDVFYGSPIHESVCGELFGAVKTSAGLVVLVGEPGTGKTTVLRRVTRDVHGAGGHVLWCDDAAPLHESVASLVSQLDPRDATPLHAEDQGLLAALQTCAGLSGATVVAVDEAQRLELAELETLCDLAEVGTTSGVPLAVLLVGQPELDVKLASLARGGAGPAYALRATLARLTAAEVGPYMAYRLDRAGGRLGDIFEPDAIERVAAYADGIPRMINHLCDATLRAASQAALATVSAATVDAEARRLDLPFVDSAAVRSKRSAVRQGMRSAGTARWPVRGWSALAGVGALVLVGGFLYALRQESHPRQQSLQVAVPLPVKAPQPVPVPPGSRAPGVGQPAPPAPPARMGARVNTTHHSARKPLPPPGVRGGTPSRRVAEAPAPPVARVVSPAARALLDAAEAGSLTKVRALLLWGASPDLRDATGMTPLMVAVIHGHGSVAELLLDRGADVDARDDGGIAALMLAAANDRVALLQLLLIRHASINATTRAGWTALTYAAWKGNAGVARRLLLAGADPTFTDRIGWTALQYAVWRAANVGQAGAPDAAADPRAVDDPEWATGARLRYAEMVGLLSRATR